MSDLESLSLEEIDRRVKASENHYKGVINFVKTVVIGLGQCLEKYEGSCHTHTVWGIKDFYGFDLKGSFGGSMMGGNHISVNYGGELVLKLYYQASDHTPEVIEIKRDAQDCRWESRFIELLNDKENAIKKYKEGQQVIEEKRILETNKKAEETKKRNELLKRAKSLGLV